MSPPLQPIRHGTEGGYQQHRRRGETACAACKAAKSEYTWTKKKARMEAQNKGAKKPRKPAEKTVRLPLKLFAELYWTASPSALAALDEKFTPKRVDELIKEAEEE